RFVFMLRRRAASGSVQSAFSRVGLQSTGPKAPLEQFKLAYHLYIGQNLQIVNQEITGTHQKALHINLDASTYGTFAEIGAGQEVARWFFRVGGAAGTIAKTISAYDMTVSDAIYRPADRYVSRQRLHTMLDHEYGLLTERLAAKRGENTRFFTFA